MLNDMEIRGDGFTIRPWRTTDATSLVSHANNRAVWRNLLGGFPFPYRMEDAIWWLREAEAQRAPIEHFAIEIDGEACGGIGIVRLEDSVYLHTRSFGYWLGEAHWGKGIMTAVVAHFIDYCFKAMPLERIEASVFAWNPASARVLEKNGFTREGVFQRRVFKDGEFVDTWLYARLREPSA